MAIIGGGFGELAFTEAEADDGIDALLANDVTSASSVTAPVIGQVHALLANDVASASSVSTPALVQIVAILANDVASASSVSTPAIGQVHGLAANDVASASSVGTPAVGQIHALLANDVASASSVTTPAVGQVHILATQGVASASSVTTPAFGQVHVLAANDVASASSVSAPALAETGGGTDSLLANDIASASSVSTPALVEIRAITDRGGDGFDAPRQRRKARHITAKRLQELLAPKEESAPVPTHKRVRAAKREIIAAIEAGGGLLGAARQHIAQFVGDQVQQFYQPDMEWRELAMAMQAIAEQAAEMARIEQEIEDEDEFLILMAA